MRQILQHLGSGRTELADVPAPGPSGGRVLIQATHSLVSLGTERLLVDFGRAGWLQKARQQPERVRQAWQKVRAEGLFATVRAIRSMISSQATCTERARSISRCVSFDSGLRAGPPSNDSSFEPVIVRPWA